MDALSRFFASWVLLASLAVAQESAQESAQITDRGAVLGWVEDRAGKKRAGADVLLISRPFPARVDVGEADVVRVVTGKDGRFRAHCLRGRAYSAWASWQDGEQVTMFTAVAEGVVPGPVVGLRDARQAETHEVVFEGLDAWQDLGPATAFAFPGSANAFPIEMTIGEGGKAVLPSMPGRNWEVELRAGNGQVLSVMRVAPRSVTTVAVPAPRKIKVYVQDWNAAPIPDAVVAYSPRYSPGATHKRLVAGAGTMTDATGHATLLVPKRHPLTNRSNSQILRVAAKGFASSLLTVPTREDGLALTLTMNTGHSITGVLIDASQQPLADVDVFVEHPIELDGKDNGFFGNAPVPVKTDKDGMFTVHGLTAQSGCRVMLMLDAERARRVGFAAHQDRSLAPIQWLAAVDQVTGDIDLGMVALAEIPMCRLEVVDHGEVPAPEARVLLLHEGSFASPIEFVTDRVGRLQFAFPDKTTRIGVFVPGGGVVLATVGSAASHALRLELMATREVTGVVVDEEGKPVAGASVFPWSRPNGMQYELADLCFRSYKRSAATGDDGKFRLVLPMSEPTFSIRALGPNTGRPTSSKLQPVDGETRTVELRLESQSR